MILRYTLFFSLLASRLFAQDPTTPLLPRYQTEQESQRMRLGPPEAPLSSGLVTPPTSPVRAMAEWEELQALAITWNGHSTILTEIVRAAREECNVLICCESEGDDQQCAKCADRQRRRHFLQRYFPFDRTEQLRSGIP